ncbi:MAG: substrate-binding periplasmic protein [Vulcanimicrobiaceae bacterium]
MIVGVKSDFPPFGYLDGDKEKGLEVDLVHHLAKDLLGNADAVTLVPVVSSNRFQYLNTGKVDFLFASVTVTDARKQVVDFSIPYMHSGWRILVNKSNTTIHDVADLKGKTVVVIPGTVGEAGIARMVPDAKPLRLTQTSEALQAVAQGRADAFVQDESLLIGLLERYPGYKVVGKAQDDFPIAAACRKGEDGLCEFVSKEIPKWESDGILKDEFKKWLHEGYEGFLPVGSKT